MTAPDAEAEHPSGMLKGTAGLQITAEQYAAATPDPVAAFSAPVAQHMNEDHADATRAIVKEVAKITVDEAKILTVDRLGFNVQCTRGKDTFKARIPFPR